MQYIIIAILKLLTHLILQQTFSQEYFYKNYFSSANYYGEAQEVTFCHQVSRVQHPRWWVVVKNPATPIPIPRPWIFLGISNTTPQYI